MQALDRGGRGKAAGCEALLPAEAEPAIWQGLAAAIPKF
jgi:hypothetical protein